MAGRALGAGEARRLTSDRVGRSVRFAAGLVVAVALAEVAARVVMANTPETVRWYDATAQLKVEQMNDADDVEVVFAGTSMAWQAFVPAIHEEVTAQRSYNAGLAGGTPEVMERWLVEEVVPRLRPRTVIWGLSSYDLAPAYGAAQRRVYDDALATREGVLADVERRAASVSSLVENRSVLRSLHRTFGAGADRRERDLVAAAATLGPGGERLDFVRDVSEARREETEARLNRFVPDASDVEVIEHTIAQLRAQQIDVILVELPVPERFVEAHPAGSRDHDRVHAALDELATRIDVRYLSMREEFDDSAFVDFSHLTEEAARSFTSRVAQALADGRDDRGTSTGPGVGTVTPGIDEDCSIDTIEDEYGFELEVLRCPDSLTPLVAEEDRPSFPASAGLAESALRALRDGIDRWERACREQQDPVPGLLDVVDRIEHLAEAVGDGDLSGPDVEGIAYAVLASPACSSAPPEQGPGVLEAAGAAVGALDRLMARTDTDSVTASAVWRAYHWLAMADWIRRDLRDDTPVSGLLVGNSAAWIGIDTSQLSETLAMPVGNAAVPLREIPTTGVWLDEILPATDPDVVIWGLSYFDVHGRCSNPDEVAAAVAEGALRRQAFGSLIPDEARSFWGHVLGPLDAESYGRSAIRSQIPTFFEAGTRGDAVTDDEPQPGGAAILATIAAEFWQLREPCLDHASDLARIVDRLVAEGRQVILLGLPPDPARTADLPIGFDAYFDSLEALVVAAGVEEYYVPLEVRFPPDHFADVLHTTTRGRKALTDAVAEAILAGSP